MNPLDDADVEDVDGTLQPTEELLNHYMGALGFATKPPKNPSTLEYAKTYADTNGRVSRLLVVIDRDQVGLEPKAPSFMLLTVQIAIDASEEAIEKRAPTYCRTDALRVLSFFGQPEEASEPGSVACDLCGTLVASYELIDGGPVCQDCKARKGHTV